jgi:hypothetical protein
MDFINFLKVSTPCKPERLLAKGLAWGIIARGIARALGAKALKVIEARGGVIRARGVIALGIIALGIVALKVVIGAGAIVDLNYSYIIGVKSMLNRAIA